MRKKLLFGAVVVSTVFMVTAFLKRGTISVPIAGWCLISWYLYSYLAQINPVKWLFSRVFDIPVLRDTRFMIGLAERLPERWFDQADGAY